jgi:predicted transposase YdaD
LHNGFKEEGIKEGIKKGMEKGIEKGKKEGKREGIEEGEEKKLIEIVTTAHHEGFTIEQIQKFTGLSKERISEIIDSASI